MSIDFQKEWEVDKAAQDGFVAGKDGHVRLPDAIANDDLLSSAWRIGNRLALSNVRGYRPEDGVYH